MLYDIFHIFILADELGDEKYSAVPTAESTSVVPTVDPVNEMEIDTGSGNERFVRLHMKLWNKFWSHAALKIGYKNFSITHQPLLILLKAKQAMSLHIILNQDLLTKICSRNAVNETV
jgi:hypothetical protein